MRIMIVEDEEIVAERLERLVRKILGASVESLHLESSLNAALEHVAQQPIDLLFLDLNLEGRDGFDLLTEAAARSFQTVVVSAQHQEALRAFEFGVTDFVPKPYDEARLRLALDRTLGRDPSLERRLKYLAVKKGKAMVPVPVASIAYIQGAGDYSEIHCDDGSSFLHHKTLTSLEQLLPEPFVRVHRSYIVSLDRVARYRSETGSRYWLELDGGQEIPVGRSRFRELRDRMP